MPTVQPDELNPGDLLPTPWVNEPSPVEVVCPRGQCSHRARRVKPAPPEKVHVKHGDAEWHIVLDPDVAVHTCDDDCLDEDGWPTAPGHRYFNAPHADSEGERRRERKAAADKANTKPKLHDLFEEG